MLEYNEDGQIKEMDCPTIFQEWVESSRLIGKYPDQYDKMMVAIAKAEPGNFWFWCGKLMAMHSTMLAHQRSGISLHDEPLDLCIHLTLIARGLASTLALADSSQ